MKVEVLKSPTNAQIDELTLFISDCFDQNTAVTALTGGIAQSRADLFRLTLRAAALEGIILVIQDPASEKLVSVGICFGPGTDFLGSQAQRDLGAEQFFANLPDETKEWWEKVNKPMTKLFIEGTIGQEKMTASWHIVVMATMKTEQRKGYATLIMKEFFRMVLEDKSFIVLNATVQKNVEFYQSLGLEVIGTADRPSPFGTWTNSLMVWNM